MGGTLDSPSGGKGKITLVKPCTDNSEIFSFLIGVNIMLLVVGCIMDIMSAILILAPILTPMAQVFGIDPVHFGILMIKFVFFLFYNQ